MGTLNVDTLNNVSSINGGQLAGMRNLIINGDMQVAQRGTNFTSQTGASYHLDRWETEAYTLGSGQYSVEQSTDSPDGFHFSTKLSCTTNEPSQDANNQMWFTQSIEGNNVQHLKFFQSNPDTVTFSFWVKSNTTGKYAFTLKLSDNGSTQGNTQTRIYATDFTIDSADTWEYKKLSITLDDSTAETKVTNNTFSMGFLIWLSAGSSRKSTTPETWSNNGNQAANTITADNFLGSTSNYFNITGVQLEVGSTATAFEHRPYAVELALCQRYYIHRGQMEVSKTNSGRWACYFDPATPMRTASSLAVYYDSTYYCTFNALYARTDSAGNVNHIYLTVTSVNESTSVGHSIAHVTNVRFDAEL